jgi:hypothetical protein
MRRFGILLALCLLLLNRVQAQDPSRYPNEVAGFRFFDSAPWRTLVPLTSTMADVRKTLGDPASAVDIAHYSDAYPGDAAAECPVFTYEFDKHWQVLIYFSGPNMAEGKLPDSLHRRLFSIDLIPRKPLHFPARFPKVFTRKLTRGADAAWNEFADGSGLCYSVYKSYTPFGGESPGDLDRISYGPPSAELARLTQY